MKKMVNLNKIMQIKGITQLNLSMEIGVSQETISAYLNGKAKPSIKTLIKIAEYFNTSTDYILDRTNLLLPISNLKPPQFTDNDFDLLYKYNKLPKNQQLKLDGYLDALSNNNTI